MMLRVLFFMAMLAIIVGGIVIIQNGVPIANTTPGPVARMRRFMTVDWAATSTDGDGLAQCASEDELAARKPIAPPVAQVVAVVATAYRRHHGRFRHRRRHRMVADAATPSPVATVAPRPTTSATSAPSTNGASTPSNDYPELVRHSYPGIPPQQLFQIAAAAAVSIPQWTVEDVDPEDMRVNAIYHTRLLPFKNDIRIVVTGLSEVDVCSESRAGEVGVNSVASLFPGDLGTNIGHIQQLYAAMAPMIAQVYKMQETQDEKRIGAVAAAP